MDFTCVHSFVHPILAGIRVDLVANRFHTWRSGTRSSTSHAGDVKLETLCVQHIRFYFLLPLQYWNSAHHRLRCPYHDGRMPWSNFHNVPSEYCRRHDSSIHGGHRVRQDDETETQNANVTFLEICCDMPERRRAMLNVPSGWFEEVAHHRSEC